jgi:N-acetyl-anhydromuramyl-L-alanine amidase AmpD
MKPLPFSVLKRFTRRLPLVSVLVALAGCGDDPPTAPVVDQVCSLGEEMAGTPAFTREDPGTLDPLFESAASEFAVPVELLKAIGWVETRWQMVEGHPEFGQPAASGVMALREDVLSTAAALAGVSLAEARLDPAANIRAAAALIRAYADRESIDGADLAAWAPAVAEYSGITLPAGRSSYVHDDVYPAIRSGVRKAGVAAITAVDARPHFPAISLAPTSAAFSTDQAGAVWRPSPNHNQRPGGEIGKVALVIIHSCEGSYTGCWSWLANPVSQVSAHYVVNEAGTEVTQLVSESARAWHIGSSYDCQLNVGFECWRNGSSNNHFTIGVEHGGYASQTSWPLAQIETSARLVCDVTRRHGISRDNIRILSHAQLQPHNRTDPGANWPWADYIRLINEYCGESGPPAELIVDGDGSVDGERGYLSVSSSWTRTSSTPGHHGDSYHFASTSSTDDPAVFHFYLPEAGMKQIDGWWTAGTNRSPSARFSVNAGSQRIAEVEVNQQRNGGSWQALGSWSFPAGWNSVRLSRQGPEGCVVIADAVRVR